MDQLLKMQKGSAQQRLPGGIGHFGWCGERKFEAKSDEIPADLLRHALRRERRAENRFLVGFSIVSSFYQGQITSSIAK
ncbi:hypothetical protein G3A39_28280 [Paraburkholderia aspalathi]|uniref:hypothetical protein n=1 Tax=Paraburkholderia nemoris TaxID=2793076 RepID=UPI00190E5773|nr:hypothetical protein [Paraburkholderia nemoris]MBK3743141.1 hypothetical protein [Paraburkholderia aspalathi]